MEAEEIEDEMEEMEQELEEELELQELEEEIMEGEGEQANMRQVNNEVTFTYYTVSLKIVRDLSFIINCVLK